MRMSAVITSIGIVAAAATTAACAGVAAADVQVAPAAPAPAATTAPAAPATAIDDRDPALKYEQDGSVVTVTKKAAKVATVTLTSAGYGKNSARIVLSVAAARPFVIDPAMFTLYDAEGWENDPTQTGTVRFESGTGSLTLTFTGTPAQPVALGWVPQYGEEAVAVWERG
ncbi:hypothetical protein [Paractinoplanes hotanensis]|uniref:DUF4352 domain-containing protein n=1 Tax=Paractinoplanes hotanensis TaxID=2906497 RepID=A0ABT0Y9J9_9ACTN|nr:hypothetical protein [Actinoplanes hotanensis]MCM4082716.1 hypothetical protein [Actinoplanes hotanensis]